MLQEQEYGNIELSCSYLIRWCEDHKIDYKENRFLDVGTNRGSLPALFSARTEAYMEGIDPNEKAILSGKEGYPQIADRLSACGTFPDHIPDNAYNVVTMFDVIEHIPDTDRYMQQIYRILKPGGWLVFQTPNKPVNAAFETLKERSFTRWKEWHCSLQTLFSLRKLLARAGFEDIRIEKFTLRSDHNKEKLEALHIPFANGILAGFELVPLILYPNLWGGCKKPDK